MEPAHGEDTRSLKKILVWNDMYGKFHYGFGLGREPFVRAGCRVDTCFMTADRSRFALGELDALVWHFRSSDLSLPQVRSPHTRYVFRMQEQESQLPLSPLPFNGLFNWTFNLWTHPISPSFSLSPYTHQTCPNIDTHTTLPYTPPHTHTPHSHLSALNKTPTELPIPTSLSTLTVICLLGLSLLSSLLVTSFLLFSPSSFLTLTSLLPSPHAFPSSHPHPPPLPHLHPLPSPFSPTHPTPPRPKSARLQQIVAPRQWLI
ncbi:hypothetical protein C7M84_010077 [Penaeus vannamei]|uniref:Fucosyltransferase N-terminal domain-containing protein n=1 Tax=Penaeus vannamei TaxID=6689 RepID=A0A3R7M356_PENVA|nr:hypothetical protein C7M84_010077 [Penaeus vannamei]